LIARPESRATDIQKQVADSAASIVNGKQLEAMPIRFFSNHKTGIIATAPTATAMPKSDDSGLMPLRKE
jgi:hypothetical protein